MLKKAMKSGPNDPLPHYYLGLAYNGKAMSREARKEFKRALKLDPDSFAAQRKLAESCAENGLIDETIQGYEKLVEMEPDIEKLRKSLKKLRELKGPS
jgi:Tfp pilus assembly protein PilF